MMTWPAPQWVNTGKALCVAVAVQLAAIVCASTLAFAAGQDKAPGEVQDLRYGVVLYHFYQQAYFDALTESLIGEEKNDMPFHGDSARLLRGGMSLSYGMSDQAENIFNQLLDTLGKPEQQNRAWFYLGKLHYLRANKDAAQQAFSHINEEALEDALREELIYYNASLLLRAGQLEHGDKKIQQLRDKSPWRAYYHFNRGAAQTIAGNWQHGVDSFQTIKALPLENNEGMILKDRAYIASGFAHLSAQQYDKAIADFVNVRLESPLVERAMLGYGWAAAQKQDFKTALAPWQSLSKRSVLNASVQESLLAIAYAYEKLHAPADALEQYIHAARVFEQELATVKEAIALFRSAPVSHIMTEHHLPTADWINAEDYLPLNKQAPYLAHLIAQDHFQAAVADHHDLVRMAGFLTQSKQRFAALNGVLALQKTVWQQSLDNALREKYRERYQRLIQAQKKLQEKMALAEREGDGRLLVSPEQQSLWRRAQAAAERIKQLEAAAYDVSEERESLRLYQGLLTWRASEDYGANRWEFKQHFVELDKLIKDAEKKLQRVEVLSVDRFDVAFAERMSAMELRIDKQAASVEQALASSETHIRELAVEQLVKQQQRLSYYLGQAKLSIARLYDLGSTEAEQ